MSRISSSISALCSNTQRSIPNDATLTMAKEPYRSTNKKGFEIQVCLALDRGEKVALFPTYLEWKFQRNADLRQRNVTVSNVPIRDVHDVSDWQLRRENFLPFARAFIPQPPRDAFKDLPTVSPRNDTTAFVLTNRITHGNARASQIARIYRLPRLRDAILDFYEEQLEGGLTIHLLDCWDRVRLQQRSTPECLNGVMPLVPVLASSPTPKMPYGLYNFVLVKQIPGLEIICLHGAREQILLLCVYLT